MIDFALGVLAGTAIGVGGWIWTWRRHWLPRTQQLELESERRRSRNESFAMELLEHETKLELVQTDLADARSTLAQCDALRLEAGKRADTAEAIVRSQAKHIEQLALSNDRALQSITDMRRVGFSLPSDILREESSDVITTVADDDLQAIKDYPHLAAGDDEL